MPTRDGSKRSECELETSHRDLTEARELVDLEVTTKLAVTTRDLERAISLLEATLDATADGLLVVDLEGRIVAFNQPFLAMWQIPREYAQCGRDEALVAFVLDQLGDPEGFRRQIREVYQRPEQESLDTLLFKDGRVFERYSAPRRLGGRVIGRVWSFRDVTRREQALRRAEAALGVLAVAAHDIRNPLGGLQLQFDLTKKALLSGNLSPGVVARHLLNCQKFVDTASALLNGLLARAVAPADVYEPLAKGRDGERTDRR